MISLNSQLRNHRIDVFVLSHTYSRDSTGESAS